MPLAIDDDRRVKIGSRIGGGVVEDASALVQRQRQTGDRELQPLRGIPVGTPVNARRIDPDGACGPQAAIADHRHHQPVVSRINIGGAPRCGCGQGRIIIGSRSGGSSAQRRDPAAPGQRAVDHSRQSAGRAGNEERRAAGGDGIEIQRRLRAGIHIGNIAELKHRAERRTRRQQRGLGGRHDLRVIAPRGGEHGHAKIDAVIVRPECGIVREVRGRAIHGIAHIKKVFVPDACRVGRAGDREDDTVLLPAGFTPVHRGGKVTSAAPVKKDARIEGSVTGIRRAADSDCEETVQGDVAEARPGLIINGGGTVDNLDEMVRTHCSHGVRGKRRHAECIELILLADGLE